MISETYTWFSKSHTEEEYFRNINKAINLLDHFDPSEYNENMSFMRTPTNKFANVPDDAVDREIDRLRENIRTHRRTRRRSRRTRTTR